MRILWRKKGRGRKGRYTSYLLIESRGQVCFAYWYGSYRKSILWEFLHNRRNSIMHSTSVPRLVMGSGYMYKLKIPNQLRQRLKEQLALESL